MKETTWDTYVYLRGILLKWLLDVNMWAEFMRLNLFCIGCLLFALINFAIRIEPKPSGIERNDPNGHKVL